MREITTDDAPGSIGPFSQAVEDGDRIYVSGQGPIDPVTDERIDGDVAEQTRQTVANIEAILDAAGASLDDVVKSTVFVRSMDDYESVNTAYGELFSEPYPARSAVEVSRLPVPIDVEIEAIARVSR